MADTETWVVTWATPEGAMRMWFVTAVTASQLRKLLATDNFLDSPSTVVHFPTLTGCGVVWLTPGQTLTVEKSG